MLLRSGNVKSGNIRNCGSKRCKLCSRDMLLKDNITFNYKTNKEVLNQNNFNCSSKNLVYMICCNEKDCQFQYIGKTAQTLRSRMNGHRSSLKTKKGCQFVVEHFTKVHRPSNMKVAPIDPVACKEMELIKEYGTLFPYGGNDRLEQPYLDAKEWFDDGKSVWNLFTHKKSKRGKRGGTKTSNGQSTDPSVEKHTAQEVIDKVVRAKYEGHNYRLIARNLLNSSRKEVVLDIGVLSKDIRDKFLQNVIIDLCRHYFSRNIATKTAVKDEYLVFKYTNRYLEDFNLAKLCNSSDLLNAYPCVATKLVPSFSYTNPIRNKILNYKAACCDADGSPPTSCCCENSPFKDPVLGHVVTGNLAIIGNRKLRNLVSKGLTFRECYKFKKIDVIKSIENDLDAHIKKQSSKKNIPELCFQLWKNDLLTIIKDKLGHIKIRRFKKPTLFNKKVKSDLKNLHSDFVLVPTDKASSNISIVCKKYYHECMVTELSSDVYEHVQQSESDISCRHVKEMNDLDIKIEEENNALPFIYNTIKQHKNPASNRFIVSGKKCSTKALSKQLLKIFQLVGKTMKSHCQYKCKFAKTKSFWIINNSNDIRNDISNLNNKNKAKTLFSYDFAKLYTNIPHDLLIENIKFAIEEAFNIKDVEFIKLNKRTATWAKKKPKNTKVKYVTKDDVMEMLQYLLDNIYVKYMDSIFRQLIGVPMGTDCAPDLANLFLFVFEYKYVMNLINMGDPDIRLFKFVYRYIDDLLIINDIGHFDSIYKNIYPDALELKSTGISNKNVNYLDLNISCNNGKFQHTLYDKRKDFNFNVISMPNLTSNIPIKQAYGVFYSQIVRMFNANTEADLFIDNVKALMKKLCYQGFNLRQLFKYLNKFLLKFKFTLINKFWKILNCSMFR